MAYTLHARNNAAFEVWATGNTANGMAYDSTIAGAGTDYSKQAAAQCSGSDGTTSALSAIFTSASPSTPFTSAMVGNGIFIASGTGADAGLYFIVGFGDANTVTLNAAPSTGGSSDMAYKIGGATATPGRAAQYHIAGNHIYVKAGAYTTTTASNNVASGTVLLTAGATTNNAGYTSIEGYQTTRGDLGLVGPTWSGPVITLSTGTMTVFTGAVGTFIGGIAVDVNSQASVIGFEIPVNGSCSYCWCGNGGTAFRGVGSISNCYSSASAFGFGDASTKVLDVHGCVAKNATTTGFYMGGQSVITDCISIGATQYGFRTDSGGAWRGCVAVGCTLAGFYRENTATVRTLSLTDCVSAYNSTYGYNDQTAWGSFRLLNCASVGNTTARSVGVKYDVNPAALNTDPFQSRTTGDFRLNWSQGGNYCRDFGWPAYMPRQTNPTNAFLGTRPTKYTEPVGAPADPYGWPDAF